MLRSAVSLVILIHIGGCLSKSVVTPNDAATANTGGDGNHSGGTHTEGSGGTVTPPGGTGADSTTGGAISHIHDSSIVLDASSEVDASTGDSGANGDASLPANSDGLGAVCGGIAALSCDSGLACIDDPRDTCEPLNGGVDCSGVCVRDMLCGGIASILCQPGESCIDDPRDNCDPLSGGADCGGLCLPQSASAACNTSDCSAPAPGAPNALCDDGVTVSGPACLRDSAGTCTWQNLSCPTVGTSACQATGCSGEVCSNAEVTTTCVFLPEFDCLKHSDCGAYGPSGACAWKDTPAYDACLKNL